MEIALVCDSRTTSNIAQLLQDGNLREGSECVLKCDTKELASNRFDVVYVFCHNVEIGHLPTNFVKRVNGDQENKYKRFIVKYINHTYKGVEIALEYIKISSVCPGFEGLQPYDPSSVPTFNTTEAIASSTLLPSDDTKPNRTKRYSHQSTERRNIDNISSQKGQSTMTQNYTKQFEKFIEQLTNDICKTVLCDALSKFQQELSNSTTILNKCVSTTSAQLDNALENSQKAFAKDTDNALKTLTKTTAEFENTIVNSAKTFKETVDISSQDLNNTVSSLIDSFEKSTLGSARQLDGELSNVISKIESSTGVFIEDFDTLTQNLKDINAELSIAGKNIAKSTEALPELTKSIVANTEYCAISLEKLAEQESDLGKIIKANYDAALELYADDIESHFKLALAAYSDEVKSITSAQLTTFESLLKKALDKSNSDTTKTFHAIEQEWSKKIEQLNKSFDDRSYQLNAKATALLDEKAREFSSISKNHSSDIQKQLQTFINDINPTEKFKTFTADINGMKKSIQDFTAESAKDVCENKKTFASFITEIKTEFLRFRTSNAIIKLGKINKLAIAILIFQILNFAGLLGLAYLLLTHMGILNL